MEKVDLKRERAEYSARSGRFDVLDVPRRRYVAVDGEGDPNTAPAYAEAIATLFPVSYAVKFASKRELDRDYVVMPLEALWWAEDMASFTSARDKSAWSWTAMMLVPEWVDDEVVHRAASRCQDAPAIDRLHVLTLEEGPCIQTLHVGSYDDEGPVLARLHEEVIPAGGWRMVGRHHEIYLSDARRTAPERLRTILRQPVAPA